MSALDSITIIVAVLLAVLGLCLGFGRTLRFFTKGLFGVVISVFVCATFGGMIAGIPAVAEWISGLNARLGEAWGFLETIRFATVVYYILLFLAVQIVRIIVVKCVVRIFSSQALPVRILNRALGAALAVAAVLLLLLLVFALFRVFEDTAFVQDILSQMEGSFLASLYANNPVNFIA